MFFFPFVFFFVEKQKSKTRTGKAFHSAKFCSLDALHLLFSPWRKKYNRETSSLMCRHFLRPGNDVNSCFLHPGVVYNEKKALEWGGGNGALHPTGLWTPSKYSTLGWGKAWHYLNISLWLAYMAPCLLGWFVALVFRKLCLGNPNASLSPAVGDSGCLGTNCCAPQCFVGPIPGACVSLEKWI